MRKHFYDGINIAKVIDELSPNLVVELGLGEGMLMFSFISYMEKKSSHYKYIGVSDSVKCPLERIPISHVPDCLYISGITYRKLADWKNILFPDGFNIPIDLCIVDSDHNYYTVKKELECLYPILSEKCCILFHDTEKEGHWDNFNFTNMSRIGNTAFNPNGYMNGEPYPLDDIKETLDFPITKEIYEFLEEHKDFKFLCETQYHCGCIAIGRNFEYTIKGGESAQPILESSENKRFN